MTVWGNNSNEFLAYGLCPTLTPFLRFDNVEFRIDVLRVLSNFIGGTISSLENTFNAFKDSKLVIEGSVDQNDPECFPNHTEMLDYISNQVLPISILHSSQSCKFDVTFYTDSEIATDFVSSILQLPAIAHKSNILIELTLFEYVPQLLQFRRPFSMPIEGTAKWLHHSEGTGNGKERVLCINLPAGIPIENPREIFNHLKGVNFYANFYFSFQFSSLLKFK